jgi:hypothetical protein
MRTQQKDGSSQSTAVRHNLSGHRRPTTMASSSATGGGYRYNNNDAVDHDTDDHSDVDAYLAREAQKKQTAPIECIDTFIKTTTNHHGNDNNNNNNNKKGSFSKRQQQQQHPVDDEELSVLTMEPALQAISRREAEGLITYPSLSQHRRENNNKTNNNKKKHLSAMEEEEDHDDDDDYMVDDLSEIAPLDLVSL